MSNEVDKFLEEIKPANEEIKANPFAEPEKVTDIKPPKEKSEEKKEDKDKDEEDAYKPSNRRERRLLKQNQRLREEVLTTNARLEGINEAKKFQQATEESEFRKIVEPIYGTDTPEKRQATELLQNALERVYQKSREDSVREYKELQTKEQNEIKESEDFLESEMERLEEEHNVDFSNASVRKGFLNLLEKLSPKDKDGDIVEYADLDAVYEIYESRKEKSSERAKELAARGMNQGGVSKESKIEDDVALRYLRENGVI